MNSLERLMNVYVVATKKLRAEETSQEGYVCASTWREYSLAQKNWEDAASNTPPSFYFN